MKKSVKWLIIAVLLVGIIVGATLLYKKLSKDYSGNNLMDETQMQDETESKKESKNENAAPDFTVLDREGNEVKLSDYKGKPVVLNFWATWCYYCRMEMPDFNEAYKKYPDVQFLMVNATDGVQETVSSAAKYVDEEEFQFDIFFDTKREAINAYRVTGFPSTFFIDKDGNLITHGSGMLNMETLEKGISIIIEDENHQS